MMNALAWHEHTLKTPDLELAWYDTGDGPAVLILHGGPGDDHFGCRGMAEPLAPEFRCILSDQRGSGRSRLERLDATTLDVERFVEDIEPPRHRLQVASARGEHGE